jgi:hypothetical protein
VLAPIEIDGDPFDVARVKAGFDHVLDVMQTALDRLYAERRYPILG